jgi:hypothetical protein
MTAEAASEELPLILQGSAPPTQTSTIGSGNIASIARAVVLGGAYEDETIRESCVKVSGARNVPWLKQDKTKPTPPLGPSYGEAMVQRVREAIHQLEKEGKLDGNDGGVYFY